MDAVPDKIIRHIEKDYFKKSISEIREESKSYLQNTERLADIKKAEQNARYKMAFVFTNTLDIPTNWQLKATKGKKRISKFIQALL